jgi:hypothetical protein
VHVARIGKEGVCVCVQGCGGETNGKRPLIRPRRIRDKILKCIFKIQDGDAKLIHLAQDDRWRNLVNTVMKLWAA